jgi:hypothetical protein
MVKGSAGVVGSINGNDSQYNELQFISSYIRTYYKEHEAIPDEEQVYTAYLQQTGYSKLDADRRKRFSNNYAYVVSTFKPELTKSISYELGEYIHLITQTDEELTEWCRSNTCYESNIYQIDADLALGYIYTCSLNKMNKSRNRAVKRLTKIEGISKEQAQERLKNTCSVNGMHEWFEFKIKEHGIYEVKKIRTCNRAKAGALFELLLYLNLIECEYDDYSTGVARKYKLKDAG